VLVILDGWGLSPEQEGNAILGTPTPNFDQILSFFPHASLGASGEEVGLSWGEMGNSEVGHLNLGTGRIIMQDLGRIDKSIQDGSFFKNPTLKDAFLRAQRKNANVHLVGLGSSGGVHSHLNHLFALLDMAKSLKFTNIFIHFLTDGRDTPPKVALNDLKALTDKMRSINIGKIASVGGRYFAMDRDKHWDRIEKAYEAFFSEKSPAKPSAEQAVNEAYSSGKTDEFVEPVRILDTPRIREGDSIIFFNFRSDRVKQISESIINANFNNFNRSVVLKDFYFVSFTSYGHEPSPNVKVAFFADIVKNQLGKLIASSKLTQLHIAETEKYAHVTYFFNGGVEEPFPGEQRILVKSSQVPTYDLKPEMSAIEIANNFIQVLKTAPPTFTVLNLANPDMVGHTGVFEAVKIAIATTDNALGLISNATLSLGGNLIITADHGNAEQMINPITKEVDKEHTTNPVPLILALSEKRYKEPIKVDMGYKVGLAANTPAGVLADVTATCVDLLGLPKPEEFSGQSLRGVL